MANRDKLNILFLEPYLGGSHKAFLDGMMRHSGHNIIPITMSDKYWKWRMSGGSVTLAQKSTAITEEPDLIFASSMTNLPAFIALTNPRFANTPSIMYMQENQLTMPLPEGEERDYTYCYINYLSALVAGELWFSSKFHFNEFMQALPVFLSKYNDLKHKELIDRIRDKSRVVYPGLSLKEHNATPDLRKENDVPVVVWNQRWEYDRNPEMFFRIMNRLDDAECEFNLILAGDHLQVNPSEFEALQKRYGDRILHYGYASDAKQYSELLHKGDIVVSTSRYEFFCTALLEAVYCGCHPMVPNALTYPELIPESLKEPLLHGPVFYNSEDDLFKKMQKLLNKKTATLPKGTLKNIVKHLNWESYMLDVDAYLSDAAKKI